MFTASVMLKQGSYLCHLFLWLLLLLLPHFSQPSSPYQCDGCGDKCWKCLGRTKVPTSLEKDLEALYLSDNVLRIIPGRSFSRYGKMKELRLNNCSLKIVHGAAFYGLNDLEYVDLSHNKISESLPKTVFRSNINLGEVSLDYNNIVRIKPHFLESMSIRKLDMTSNGVTEVSPESFKLLPNLEELRLEKNRLKVLPPNLLPSEKNILNLYIDQSTLVVYSCNPRLPIFVGGKQLQCDTAETDVAIYTIGGESENTADQEVEMQNTEFIENNKSENPQISKDVKYTQSATSTSTSQPSTNGKIYSSKPKVSTPINSEEPIYSAKPIALPPMNNEKPIYSANPTALSPINSEKPIYSAKPTALSPINSEKPIYSTKPTALSPINSEKPIYSAEPTALSPINSEKPIYSAKPTGLSPINSEEPIETFVGTSSENVQRKMILLILTTIFVLVVSLILYAIIKRCSCRSPRGMQQPQIVPPLCYNQLIPFTGDGNIPMVHGYRTAYVPVRMLQVSRYPDQMYQPQWRGSQFSDHTYQEIVYS